MQTFNTISELQAALNSERRKGKRIAFVPTMGNLHEGHLQLIDRAHLEADIVVASLFVNPLQFSAGEDFASYPRTLESDSEKLSSRGCNFLFAPTAETLYPQGLDNLTLVHVPGVSEGLCAQSRKGHFDGVATVVSLLFHIVWPDIACFGEKDFQQLAVIRKMVADLHMPITIIGVQTVRADDGLALSSRNGYLSDEQRTQAAQLSEVLKASAQALKLGNPLDTTLNTAQKALEDVGFKVDYIEARNSDLSPFNPQECKGARLLAAVFLGNTRLIDNVVVC